MGIWGKNVGEVLILVGLRGVSAMIGIKMGYLGFGEGWYQWVESKSWGDKNRVKYGYFWRFYSRTDVWVMYVERCTPIGYEKSG